VPAEGRLRASRNSEKKDATGVTIRKNLIELRGGEKVKKREAKRGNRLENSPETSAKLSREVQGVMGRGDDIAGRRNPDTGGRQQK